MPLPLIIGGIAALAGVAGVGSGIHGGVKMKEANDTMKMAKMIQEEAVELFEKRNKETTELMDEVGKQELKILASFEQFANIIEKIQGRPEFKEYEKNGVQLPQYEAEELKNVSTGAGVLLGGIGGAAVGTAGGFAAAGGTVTAVMALGTASTGTAISSLGGAALTNATLAALGGGSIAAGGGGVALGSAILSGATLGVGLLVSGVVFNITGSKLSDKADEAFEQARETGEEVKKLVRYFDELSSAAEQFGKTLSLVDREYQKKLASLDYVVNDTGKVYWSEFTDAEKLLTENTVLLVGLLYKMCKVNLVIKSTRKNELDSVNNEAIDSVGNEAKLVLEEIGARI